jgi:hemoglobin-like flavoprotein
MSSAIAAIEASLFAIAEANIDITPALFERFFETFPEQRAPFLNLDAAAGRMTNETIEAMIGLATNEHWVPTTIVNFVDLHRNYGDFPASLYAAFIDMTVDALAQAAGTAWAPESNAAWRAQADRLKAMVAEAVVRPTS